MRARRDGGREARGKRRRRWEKNDSLGVGREEMRQSGAGRGGSETGTEGGGRKGGWEEEGLRLGVGRRGRGDGRRRRSQRGTAGGEEAGGWKNATIEMETEGESVMQRSSTKR